jgi:hypothetical protein
VIIELSSKDDANEFVVRRMIRKPRAVAAAPPLAGQVRTIRVE